MKNKKEAVYANKGNLEEVIVTNEEKVPIYLGSVDLLVLSGVEEVNILAKDINKKEIEENFIKGITSVKILYVTVYVFDTDGISQNFKTISLNYKNVQIDKGKNSKEVLSILNVLDDVEKTSNINVQVVEINSVYNNRNNIT